MQEITKIQSPMYEVQKKCFFFGIFFSFLDLNKNIDMPAEKKRPRGLKGSAMAKAANKKTKVEEPTNGELPENAQTVVIDKVVEEGDEVGEAAALYESAIEKLGKLYSSIQ